MNYEKALKSITKLIIACCDPDEIILFGSVAKGNDHPDSDVDLLILSDFRESPAMRAQELKGLLKQLPIRIDLLLLTPSEYEIEAQKPYSFISTIKPTGKLLYIKNKNTA